MEERREVAEFLSQFLFLSTVVLGEPPPSLSQPSFMEFGEQRRSPFSCRGMLEAAGSKLAQARHPHPDHGLVRKGVPVAT